jgi:hypothetical protein
MRVTPALRKWSAAVALIAMVASAVGIASVVIIGSTSDQPPARTAAPRTTLAPPSPKVPIAAEFTIGVNVTDHNCPTEGSCTYTYTIDPKYIGFHPLPETPFTVFYEVTGGAQPQKGEFTVQANQAKILMDVVVEGPPGAQLEATVTQVTG